MCIEQYEVGHQPNRQYERLNAPKARELTRLEVAMFFNEAIGNALLDLEDRDRVKNWNSYYDPGVLKAAITALKAVKELVNK